MLGTVHVAQRIINSINSDGNASLAGISPRNAFLIRLVALIHDAAHLPFGHTLEDEGRLFSREHDGQMISYKQWESPKRQEVIFEPMAKKIRVRISEAFMQCGESAAKANSQADAAVDELKRILVQEESGQVEELEEPFIADIVGNTICADLLDYLKRDIYFTGLAGGYDDRVFSYFTIMPVKNKNGQLKKRLVINLSKNGDLHIRHDILSGLLEMLRLRYSLAERVYYHHAKREASAMIIKMVASAMKAGIIDEDKLCSMDDASLIYYIENFSENKRHKDLNSTQLGHLKISQIVAARFRGRELYKPAYELRILEQRSSKRIRELIEYWEKRFDFEEKLASVVGLEPQDIIVYVPREEMGSKTAMAIVALPFEIEQGTTCTTLSDLGKTHLLGSDYGHVTDIVKAELEVLEAKHRALWKMDVFVHRKVDEKKIGLIQEICADWFQGKSSYVLVDIMAQKNKRQISEDMKMEMAQKALQIETSPARKSHESSFSRVCSKIAALLVEPEVAKPN